MKIFAIILRWLLTIYAILYGIFVILEVFFPGEGSVLLKNELLFIILFFVLFALGYIISWRNEILAGIIFLIWYVGMYITEILTYPQGDDIGRVLGLPLLILGILFFILHYWKKNSQKSGG